MSKCMLLVGLLLGIAACGQDPGTRAVTGGAIGVGTGAVVGSTVGGVGAVPGAIVGGVGGAALGIVTTPLSW